MVDETSSLPMRFRRLAWSNLAAQSADQVALAAAPLVAVFALGATEGENGLLQVALTLPFLLAAIPAGILADRVSRRRLMAGAEVVRGGASSEPSRWSKWISSRGLSWPHWVFSPRAGR